MTFSRRIGALLLLAVVLAGVAYRVTRPGTGDSPALVRTRQDFAISRDGSTRNVPVYTSQPIETSDPSVTRAVLVIHGRSINADDYFDAIASAIAGNEGFFIAAPEFATADEDPGATQLYWGPGWAECDRSDPEAGRFRISSCEVLDEIITVIRSSFPNVKEVVVAGFSAGGQLVTRYAATNADARLSYLVGAPSSYLYWNDERPGPRCRGDNEYKYGLERLSGTSYMEEVGAETMKANFSAARVLTIVGGDDDDPESSSLDTRCEADAQGSDRVERWQNYRDHLEAVFGPAIFERHPFVEVAGIAHDGQAMLNSEPAREWLNGPK